LPTSVARAWEELIWGRVEWEGLQSVGLVKAIRKIQRHAAQLAKA
jgi:hypothetical protein